MTQKSLVDGNIEYASNSDTSDAADTTSFVNGLSGSTFPSALTGIRMKRVRFLTPILSTDTLILQVQLNTSSQWTTVAGFDGSVGIHVTQYQNGTTYGMNLRSSPMTSTDVDVQFGLYQWASSTYGAAGSAWSTGGGNWRVKKSAN